jgi:hypothetical protein
MASVGLEAKRSGQSKLGASWAHEQKRLRKKDLLREEEII